MTDERVMVVCTRLANDPREFTDNQHGVCARCGVAVIFRPHTPANADHICLQCWQQEAQPGDEVRISDQTVREFATWLMKRGGL